jgi:RNA polymerase sigma-70 factor (ECF subfamily)
LFVPDDDAGRVREPAGTARRASSMMRSGERKTVEKRIIGECLRDLITQWQQRGEYERLQCLELLFVLGWTNKATSERLGISEQVVANHKQFVVGKLKDAATKARLRNFNPEEFGL